MATNAFTNGGSGASDAGSFFNLAESGAAGHHSLRRERGFIREAGELYVKTSGGVAGARGLAIAVMLEFVAAGGVWLAWQLLRMR